MRCCDSGSTDEPALGEILASTGTTAPSSYMPSTRLELTRRSSSRYPDDRTARCDTGATDTFIALAGNVNGYGPLVLFDASLSADTLSSSYR